MKKRDLVIDADSILYEVAPLPSKDSLEGETLETMPDIRALILAFNEKIKEVEDAVAVETVAKKFKLGETLLVFSDPKSNFRYDIFPDYKKNRRGLKQSKAFYALREKVHTLPKAQVADHAEADDLVAYYVRQGAVGCSLDKDLLKGVKGRWFDMYHSRRTYRKVKRKEADHFTLLQTLAGDPTDSIPGIPRIGMKTAENLLISNGDNWGGVVKSYKNAGLTKKDAILTRRLIGMDQYNGKRIKLWQA